MTILSAVVYTTLVTVSAECTNILQHLRSEELSEQ